MDFLQAGCNISHLLKDEIAHELSIRRLTVNPASRRDSLRKVLKQTADLARRGSLKFTTLEESDLSSEITICQHKAEEIEKAIVDDLPASTLDRLHSRCKYLQCRLSRLPESSEEVQLLKAAVNSLLERLAKEDSNPSDSCSSDDQSDTCSRVVTKKIIYKPLSTFNVNSLNLKYKGDTCARTFVTRLEELRVARKISEEAIFRGFPEILDGPALSWFRSNRADFVTYHDVLKALRDDFDIPDLDYQLLQEIRSRTQSRNETIVFFVSTVLGMFERLSTEAPEAEKLDILLRNIRPEYSRELALHDVTSIKQLKSYCKRIELANVRSASFREPNIPSSSSTPTAVHKPHSFNQRRAPTQSHSFVATVNQPDSRPPCFRCGMTNHTTNVCRNSRDIVCFKCGTKGVRTPDCTKCMARPKN